MKWLREPLFHFLAIGAGLFLLFGLVGGAGENRTDRIEVSAVQVELLAEGFARTWQRPPTPQELNGLVEDHIREEIYYREAMAMGLDRDDTIVRRRMRQKLEFFTDDILASIEPPEEELRTYLSEHPEKFQVAGRVTFEQIYFNRDRRGDSAVSDAEKLLRRLQAADSKVEPGTLGDPLLLPVEYDDVSQDEVVSRLGRQFAESLDELPIGRWAGPIESGYGFHLVLITDRQPAEAPAFDEVRPVVVREWRAEQREEAKEAFYQGLRGRYEVIVEDFGAVAGSGAADTADAADATLEAAGASR